MNILTKPSTKSFQLQSVNPVDGELLQLHPELTQYELENKLQDTETTSRWWMQVPVEQRVHLISAIKNELQNNTDKIAKTITLEIGKPINESIAEVKKCLVLCDYYIGKAPELLQPTRVETSFSKSYYVLHPMGPIMLIMPWNYPIWQVFRAMIPALALGNSIVLKHAGNAQFCAQAIEDLVKAAGAPHGLVTNMPIEQRLTHEVLLDPRIRGVLLTGSVKAGRSVAATAGSRLIKSVMELGGNDPLIILKDADLEKAAQATVKARLKNCGQVCVAPKRIIAEQAIYHDFISLLSKEASGYIPSQPDSLSCKIGPMAREDLRDSFNDNLIGTLSGGGECIQGGNKLDTKGFWHEPSLLINVPRDSIAAREELFGPALCVYPADNENDAITFANQSDYGLGASIFTNDLEKAENIASNLINAGSVFINTPVQSDVHLPFGGIGNSGYGRELGHHGLAEFANTKTIASK